MRAARGAARAAAVLAAIFALALQGPERAAAVVMQNLYTVVVPPQHTAPDPRAAAQQLAMRQLLVRVTGDRDAGAAPDLQDLVASAASYVASYGELDRDRAQVIFYQSEVDRALEARNRPVWGTERPMTLVWVAVDGGQGERRLLSSGGADAAASPQMSQFMEATRQQLQDIADERGVPISFPLLDLEDLGRIGFADVWGGFESAILAASERYAADAVLVGRVRIGDLRTDVQWVLFRNGQRRLLAGTEVGEGLHWLADNYAQDFGVLGGLRTMRLLVRDVRSFTDYGRIISYLEGLSMLQSIDVESLEGDLLSLRVGARGDATVLERTFTLGRVLELADTTSGASGDGRNTLVLRLAGSAPERTEQPAGR